MTTRINNSILLILIIVFNFNCSRDEQRNDNKLNLLKENESPLNIVNRTDTIKITVKIADCGEFGGHKEHLYIQRNNENNIYARFIVDSISCDTLLKHYGTPGFYEKNRIIIFDTIKILDLKEELQISQFVQRITELYLQDGIYSNHGDFYKIVNTQDYNPFQIYYWNSGNHKETYYYKVRKLFINN